MCPFCGREVQVLHEHTAFGPVFSDRRRVLKNLSPGQLLRDALQSTPGAGAFELGSMDVAHGRQGGHMEHVTDAVLGILGRALCIGYCSDLPGQPRALFMSDGDESELGQLSQDIEVRPHVQLAAHQNHLGIGTELLRLPLPLFQHTVQGLWPTDVETDENSIRVRVSQWPYVVIVG